jgi:hypothetical protein
MPNYFDIPQNVVDKIREIHDKYELDKLNRKLAIEAEARDILSREGYVHSGQVIEYDEVMEILIFVLDRYKE